MASGLYEESHFTSLASFQIDRCQLIDSQWFHSAVGTPCHLPVIPGVCRLGTQNYLFLWELVTVSSLFNEQRVTVFCFSSDQLQQINIF